MMAGVTEGFDWPGFERALVDGLLEAASVWTTANPDEALGMMALDHIYRETDGQINLPLLGIAARQAFRDADDPWDVAAWDDYDLEWLDRDWEGALTDEACRDTTEHWEATFQRYLDMLVRVCLQARRDLSSEGDALVVLLDEDDELCETLVRGVLAADEVAQHFPEYDDRRAERAHVAALPVADRVAYYVSKLGTFEGPITSEEAERALRDIGRPAIPALVAMLAVDGGAAQAARIVAAIGEPDAEAVRALIHAMTSSAESGQRWAAAALARLGRLDAVLNDIDVLPVDVVVAAVADPYSGWRDDTAAPRPLDYRPLADFIERWPDFVPALNAELRPGHPSCTIRVDEVDEAVRGLASPHVIVRRHAVDVLGEHRLGPSVAARVLPLLHDLAEHDPDPDVRRLSLLSAEWLRGRTIA